MKLRSLILLLALLLIALFVFPIGCGPHYYKCRDCGAAYKGNGIGLPGQGTGGCRSCDSERRLQSCSEAESGWDEERYRQFGDEL